METDKLSPEKSFELITQVITQARNKFEENGFIYMFWGVLSTVAAFSQFFLLKMEYYNIHWYPYFIMPLGSIYTFFYYSKKKLSKNKNQISKIVSYTWLFLTINVLILGFLFGPILKESLIPILLILLAMGFILSGTSINSKIIIISGSLLNISAFICFYIDWIYQPLLLGIVSIFTFIVPGVLMMIINKRKKDV